MSADSGGRCGSWEFSREEKLRLVNWLFSLEFEEMNSLAKERLAKAFPTAPEAMIETATFHLYVDGKDAALDWIAEVARFLQTPDQSPPCYGHTWHLLYHVYNWWQFCALLPIGKPGLQELVKEVRELIEEGSPDAALSTLKILEDSLDGSFDHPKFDE